MPEITDAELAEFKAAVKKLEKAQLEASLAKDAQKKAEDAAKDAKDAHTAELAKVRAGYERGSVFDKSGIEDAKVRRYFELDFEEQAGAGGEADFAKWFGALDAEKAPHLAPFLPKPADNGSNNPTTTTKGKPAGGGGGLPDTATGAKPPGSGPAFTAESVHAMTLEEFKASRSAIATANPDLGLVQIPDPK